MQERAHHNNPVVLKNLIIENPVFMYPLPTSVGAIRIEYMDVGALLGRLRIVGTSFPAIEGYPPVAILFPFGLVPDS
jgi:hypothetical protein